MRLTVPKIKLPTFKGVGTKTALAVHVTDRTLRILELNKDLEPVFEPVQHQWAGRKFEEKVDILRSYVEKHNLKGRDAISALPVNDGLLKYYTYPATLSQKDLLSSIEWAVKREQSLIKEETTYDYFIMKKTGDDKLVGVVIVFARKESVNSLIALMASAGLRLKTLDYEVVALLNYGIREKFPIPFSILYVDYDYFIMVNYLRTSVSYSSMHIDVSAYLSSLDQDIMENFFAEVRNQIVLSDINNLYLAGPMLEEQAVLDVIMENLPIMGLLDLPNLKPGFIIPYILSIRGVTE